jgi:hypothetical protein
MNASRGLGRGEAGDRHAEGRAGDVVQPDLVAEVDDCGVAAVLAADADLEVRLGAGRPFSTPISTSWPTPVWSSDWNGSFAPAGSPGEVVGQEGVDVVAAVAEGHLRQVVGAEAEEVGVLGDLVGGQRARGISIIVPMRMSSLPLLAPSFLTSAMVSRCARAGAPAPSGADQRDHDLGCT